MTPASNWLSFSLSPMEMLRSSSEPQFVSYEGSSAAAASPPHYLIDNFYANGWTNPKHQVFFTEGEENQSKEAHPPAMADESPILTSFHHQAPKLEDFFGDSSSIVRYSDSQTETQDSSLTQIYDHSGSAYFNEHQDLKAITGFQAFSTNSGSEVDDSASMGRTQFTGVEFPGHSIESSGSSLFFAGGAYDYKGCSPDIPSSNILVDECRKHAYTMKHCRTDVSNAWRAAAWVRIPYPLQWGVPIFHFRTSLIMIIVSLVASVDSVGTYHSASLLVSSKPPTPQVVSRGIALEGFCSMLAGLWGSGTGSTTLTENTHTINITKMASRRAVVFGALFLILFSFVGKVGAILASIPLSLAASILCFMWALVVAVGLSTLQYSETASFRNITIVGVSLFLGLSIPAYFQQYQPDSSLILPSYFVPYAAASNGPVHTVSEQLNFAISALMSMSMVVTLLIAFVLDNTVPGSRQERGVYIWSRSDDVAIDPSLQADYSLPEKCTSLCCCSRCLLA